jgi:hypothetical protein
VKQRLLVLPDGSQVDSQDREAWQFPEHTLFFKTFSYQDAAAADGLRPIETRVLQKTAEGWDYHVYLWSKERDTARLLDGIYTTPVEVESAGETFDHVVPARLDCRKCHESQPVVVIGFDELRLNAPLHGAESETQLTRLGAQGILSDVAETPDMVRHSDPTTEQVLGYLHGNCAHCHNGWDGPSSAFDMRHAAALKNLINVETTSELLSGLRLAPGSAQDSAIYRAMARDPSFPDAAAMPPVGVDLVDRDAVLLLQSWIDDM